MCAHVYCVCARVLQHTVYPLQCMEEEFVRWMDWYGKSYGEFELMKGDFLDSEFDETMQSAT